MLKTAPAVFAVGRDYQIMVEVKRRSLFWVRVGSEIYYDATGGVMNSLSSFHRVTVPMEVLDSAGEYTVCVKPVYGRSPYFTKTGKTVEQTFPFYPVPQEDVRIYHIADTHNRIREPIKAAKAFGEIDLLILNGDVISNSGGKRKCGKIYQICSALTRGSVPVVFSRGNHDMRGKFAERFSEYTPCQKGNTYYSFRMGGIWGVILDCGEDKADDHPEYGGTVACHPFRVKQTAFLRKIIENAQEEYGEPGVKTRLVICHVPFTQKDKPPFDIEAPVYREWARLLREYIKPDLMLCGHTHETEICYPGGPKDAYGQPCPVVIGSAFDDRKYWAGCGLILRDQKAEVRFTDSRGAVLSSASVPYEKEDR